MIHVAGYVSDQLVKGSHWTTHLKGYENGSILIGAIPRGTGEQRWRRAWESMGDLIPQSPNLNTERQMGTIFIVFNFIEPTISQCRHSSAWPHTSSQLECGKCHIFQAESNQFRESSQTHAWYSFFLWSSLKLACSYVVSKVGKGWWL